MLSFALPTLVPPCIIRTFRPRCIIRAFRRRNNVKLTCTCHNVPIFGLANEMRLLITTYSCLAKWHLHDLIKKRTGRIKWWKNIINLLLTFAEVGQWILFLSLFAFANIRTNVVNTFASNTQTRNGFTFIHICNDKKLRIKIHSISCGAQPLFLLKQKQVFIHCYCCDCNCNCYYYYNYYNFSPLCEFLKTVLTDGFWLKSERHKFSIGNFNRVVV